MSEARSTQPVHNVNGDGGIRSLIEALCRYPTGVVADANEALFARIGEELPLRLYRFASGALHNGWEVPRNWKVERALIRKDGAVVFDGTAHTLGVARYARSFRGTLNWDALKPRLITNPALPDAYMFHCAWQYRPWDADWAFSVPFDVLRAWTPGRYEVDLETTYEDGEMLVGVCDHRGRTDRTIVFNSHTCHPHQANDGFSGVALLIRLFQWLRGRDTWYSYRLVLGPEHLGTVFYLRDLDAADLDRLVGGLFVEMTGTQGPLKAASTFLGDQPIDRVLRRALRDAHDAYGPGAVHVPWRKGAGNDETVWEAPGVEVPFIELTRCEDQFAPYPEYHSSLDTPALMDPERLAESYRVLQAFVETLEKDAVLHRTFDGLVCLSNPAYDLYLERHDPTIDKGLVDDTERWGALLDSLLRYFDGRTTILDVAERHDLPFAPLHAYLERFVAKGLLVMEPALIDRTPRTCAFQPEFEDVP